jgi:hypothetical protein
MCTAQLVRLSKNSKPDLGAVKDFQIVQVGVWLIVHVAHQIQDVEDLFLAFHEVQVSVDLLELINWVRKSSCLCFGHQRLCAWGGKSILSLSSESLLRLIVKLCIPWV